MQEGAVCIPNIGPREQQKRRVLGLKALGVTAVVLAALLLTGQPPWTRLPLFLLLFFASGCLFQARAKT